MTASGTATRRGYPNAGELMTILEAITERFDDVARHDFEALHPGATLAVEQTNGRAGAIKADGEVVGEWTLSSDDQSAEFRAG